MRNVMCVKLKQELPGLARDPYGNDLGKRIYAQVSQQAWDMWLDYQKILLNEYRLNLADKKARQFLSQQAEAYFFGDGGMMPSDYKAPTGP
jgi:Fe-S cluster biosynthesis and repair protein YggX